VNKRVYNSIDKNEIFAEAFSLWKSGFDWQVINSDDKKYLNKYEFDFTAENMEKELILRFFSKDGAETPMTATEIKAELERMTQQKLSLDMIGRHLAAIGYERKSVRRDGQSSKMWIIKRVNRPGDYTTQNPNSDITTKEKTNGNGYEPIEGEGF
jgi:predicted P-loop ATPase